MALRPLPTEDDPLVRALPDDLRPAAVEALAATPAYYEIGSKDLTARTRWAALLEQAGFGRYTIGEVKEWYARPVPPPETWTARQRSVARLFAEVPGMRFDEYPLYASTAVQRQAMGLEPKGPLFDLVDGTTFLDRFRVLVAHQAPTAEARAMIDALPLERRLVMLGELMLCGECSDYRISEWLPSLWPQLGAEGKAWAPAYADRLLALFEDPRGREVMTSNGPALRGAHGVTVLLALVRAGVALEPRWDTLFTMWHLGVTPELWEIVEAVPPERREAVVTRVARSLDLNYLERWAPELLRRYPLAEPTRFVLSKLEFVKKPRDFMKALKTVAAASPPMAAVLAEHAKSKPKIPKLTLGDRAPLRTLADLDEVAQAQLVEANRRYGGTTMTAAAIMNNTGEEEPEGAPQIETPHLERGRVLDAKGNHLYDVLLYNVDAGTVFEAGSTRVVADVVQADVQAADQALALGLTQALAGGKKRRAPRLPR